MRPWNRRGVWKNHGWTISGEPNGEMFGYILIFCCLIFFFRKVTRSQGNCEELNFQDFGKKWIQKWSGFGDLVRQEVEITHEIAIKLVNSSARKHIEFLGCLSFWLKWFGITINPYPPLDVLECSSTVAQYVRNLHEHCEPVEYTWRIPWAKQNSHGKQSLGKFTCTFLNYTRLNQNPLVSPAGLSSHRATSPRLCCRSKAQRGVGSAMGDNLNRRYVKKLMDNPQQWW